MHQHKKLIIFNHLIAISLEMSQESRAPTKAQIKIHPSAELFDGNLFPYIDYSTAGLAPYFSAFRRVIAPINPFAHQQVPTSDRAAIGPRYGPRWYFPDVYPNSVAVDQNFPNHYNPFANPRRQANPNIKYGTNVEEEMAFKIEQGPRFCMREILTYKRCLFANDQQESKCKHEQQNILAICPGFSLDIMRNRNLQKLKMQALNNNKYREAMAVGSYNIGRTVADLPRKTWGDGTRKNLRPDTLWADDRYVDVTQKEIDEAKARVKKRMEQRGQSIDTKLHIHTYDRSYQEAPRESSLYP